MIKELNIKQFRGIKQSELSGMKRFNFFVGSNNSGKTTILEALFLSIGISNPLLPLRIDSFRNLFHSDNEDFRHVFYNLDYNNVPQINIKLLDSNSDERTRNLKISPHKQKDVFGGAKEPKKAIENMEDLVFDTRIDNDVINGLILESSIKEKHTKQKEFTSKIYKTQNGIQTELPNDYEEVLSGVFIFPSAHSPSLDKRIERLIVKKELKQIIPTLKIVDERIEDISLGTDGVIYIDIGIERLVPLNLSGDGIRRILSILVTALDTKNGTLFIDEIDNGLYYKSQEALLKALFKISCDYNIQIFSSTHNYETLRIVKNILNESEYVSYQNDVTISSVRKLKEDIVKTYTYGYQEFAAVIEEEIEIR